MTQLTPNGFIYTDHEDYGDETGYFVLCPKSECTCSLCGCSADERELTEEYPSGDIICRDGCEDDEEEDDEEEKNFYKVATAECPDVDYFDTLQEAKDFCDEYHDLDYGYIMLCDADKEEIGDWGDYLEEEEEEKKMMKIMKEVKMMKEDDEEQDDEEEEREYTIEKQVCGMGYMSFYDEKDMLEQIVYCKNGCWKLKGDKTSRDLEGELCITDDEEEEEEEDDEEEDDGEKSEWWGTQGDGVVHLKYATQNYMDGHFEAWGEFDGFIDSREKDKAEEKKQKKKVQKRKKKPPLNRQKCL